MKRIPEEELMDDEAQAEAYAGTDFSEPHEAFVTYFKERFPGFTSGEILDIGCGTGDVIIRCARSFPKVHITGIDGADAMLAIAERDIASHGYSDRIKLNKCLLPDPEVSDMKYDAVISNSILHHLADHSVLWDTVKNCARPDAPIFIMDLYRPDTPDIASALVEEHASDASAQLKEDFYNSLLAAYTPDEITDQLRAPGLEQLNIEKVSDRHVLIWGKA